MTLILKKWTPRIAQRASETRLNKIDALLIDIALLWGDEDESLVRRAEDLRIDVDDFKKEMAESLAEREQRHAEERL